MGLLYLKQGGNQNLDVSLDGFTDTLELGSLSLSTKDLQLVRNTGTGQPLVTFEISNDSVNWSSWEVEGFIFKDPNFMFSFNQIKQTYFRLSWLSNTSTGDFTANFNVL